MERTHDTTKSLTIHTYIHTLVGIQLPRSLVMKAKIHHNISRGKLRHIAKHIVDESDAPQAVKAMIMPHLRIVATKQPSLLDILTGHRRAASKMEEDRPPE